MAYRRSEYSEPVEAASQDGKLTLTVGAQFIKLATPLRSVVFADKFATLTEHRKRDRRSSWKLDGRVIVARHVPKYELGIWLESNTGLFRVFGVEPSDMLAETALTALRGFDRVAQQLRVALRPYAGAVDQALEIGPGVDKVLLVRTGETLELFVRPLFRDRVRRVLTARSDGTVAIAGSKTVARCESRYGVSVRADYVTFFDRHGTDLARVALPWILPEDRREIARMIGDLFDATATPQFAVNAF